MRKTTWNLVTTVDKRKNFYKPFVLYLTQGRGFQSHLGHKLATKETDNYKSKCR